MSGQPPCWLEATVAVLLPPACRESILGDLQERYKSPGQYAVEASRAIPLVVVSRIRRVANAGTRLLEMLGMYASFLAAGRLEGGDLAGAWALWSLAIPPAALLCGLWLGDAYASPEEREGRTGLLWGAFGALVFAAAGDALGVPRGVAVTGGGLSLLFVAMVRRYMAHGTGQTPAATGLDALRKERLLPAFRRHFGELPAVLSILLLLWLVHQTAK